MFDRIQIFNELLSYSGAMLIDLLTNPVIWFGLIAYLATLGLLLLSLPLMDAEFRWKKLLGILLGLPCMLATAAIVLMLFYWLLSSDPWDGECLYIPSRYC